jgi:hypothetical protein
MPSSCNKTKKKTHDARKKQSMKDEIVSSTHGPTWCHPQQWFGCGVARVASFSTSVLLVAYVITTLLGFASLQSPDDPIEDPYFTLMEVFILLIMPFMMVAMLAFHQWTPPAKQLLSLGALVFLATTMGITSSVHFVVWTVGRPISDQVENAGYLFSFSWPSVVYALDILAWDWFFGLSMILAAFAVGWTYRIEKALRILMLTSGILCLVGLIALPLDNMQVRIIGIVGYAIVTIPIFALVGVCLGRSTEVALGEHSTETNGVPTKQICEETVDHDVEKASSE